MTKIVFNEIPLPKNKIRKMLLEKKVNKFDNDKTKDDLNNINKFIVRPRNLKFSYDIGCKKFTSGIVATTLLTAFSSAILFAFANKISNVTKSIKHLSIDEEQAINDEFSALKQSLTEKYPTLDLDNVDANSILSSLKNQYENCFIYRSGDEFHPATLYIKEGWENYYIDYNKNDLYGGVLNSINDICGGNAIVVTSNLAQNLAYSALATTALFATSYMIGIYPHQKAINKMRVKLIYYKCKFNSNSKHEFKENVHKAIYQGYFEK